MAMERYRLEPLGRQHSRADFACGVEALDRYIHQQAGQDRRRMLAAPYVLLDSASGVIAGYYTLSSMSLLARSVPEHIVQRLARYPVFPLTLIGRLAVDLCHRRQGLGERLLLDALRRSLASSREVASMAVVVDAQDESARSFYEGYGFARVLDDDYRLYLSLATVSQLR